MRIDISSIILIGDAKKYYVASGKTKILSIPVDRPHYRQLLQTLTQKYCSITVVGDNFSLDISTPLSMGLSVAFVPNQLTPSYVINFVKSQSIPIGDINEIIEQLTKKVRQYDE